MKKQISSTIITTLLIVTSPLSISSPIQYTVQAEAFNQTSGNYQPGEDQLSVGFETYTTAAGIDAINYVQTGDWGLYNIQVPVSGYYKIDALLGTAVYGAKLKLTVEWIYRVEKEIYNNGNWDQFIPRTLAESIYLDANIPYQMRLLGSGSNGWEWNADKIVFTQIDEDTDQDGILDGPDKCDNTPTAAHHLIDTNGCYYFDLNPLDIVTEAEDFIATGGDFNGAQTYTIDGTFNGINFVQTGDWVEYEVDVSYEGFYSLSALVGTAVEGAAMDVYIDNRYKATIKIDNNNNWDEFSLRLLHNNLYLYGKHTIRLEGSGSHGWEWNIDKLTLNKTGRDNIIQSYIDQQK